MTSRRFKLATGAAALLFLYGFVISGVPIGQAQEPEGNFGVGIPETFLPKYLDYRARQLAAPNPDVMRIRLGYVKGLSRSFTAMVGQMAVNLGTGGYDVSLNRLTLGDTYSVWLVDQPDTDGTLAPDTEIRLATVLATAPTATLTGALGNLMRSSGLILENLDGLSDPANKFVMRGVPHTLGLQVSLQQDTSQPNAPAEMTGWSGDGSPGTGSLREFALGAVTQHFTKSLQRGRGT